MRLTKMAYGHKTEHRLRVCAQVVLHAARGRSDACIARETGLHVDTVRRRLAQDALKPWQHRSWIFITSLGFRLKAVWVLDLYARTWQGEQLGDDEYVISADEEISLQARCRCHPTLAPGKARAMRVNHTYGRGGAPGLPRRLRRPRREGVRPHRRTHREAVGPEGLALDGREVDLDLVEPGGAGLDRHTADHHEESSVAPAA
ncbi:hypothetical protein ACFVJH_38850 [Streptomyces decoyicus]|uniref:hypothetical protein n=1 Tax=Streptomyces decoyicus TaxID=249567 RepID=UPI003642B74B